MVLVEMMESCRLGQAAATGHEEPQAMATGQEKKSAATRDNEQALAEAPSSAIDKGLLKDSAAFPEMSLEAFCPCGVTGSEKNLGNEQAAPDDDRRQTTEDDRQV